MFKALLVHLRRRKSNGRADLRSRTVKKMATPAAETVRRTTTAERRDKRTLIHITALDGIVNVNSLFTLAVFIGLSWNPADETSSLVQDASCIASQRTSEDLVSFEIYSFTSFLFSSLVAQGMKQAMKLTTNHSGSSSSTSSHGVIRAYVDQNFLRYGILISALGSISGCAFLMLALVNVVQIKLGILACKSYWTLSAVIPLVILVPAALLIYVVIVGHAFMQ